MPDGDWAGRLGSALAGVEDQNDRILEAAAVIQARFALLGVAMTLVGGSAFALHAPAVHTSGELDFVSLALRDVLDRGFSDLGLTRDHGRHWINEELRVYAEVPGSVLEPAGALVVTATTPVRGATVRVVDFTGLTLDRLQQAAAGPWPEIWDQAVELVARLKPEERERVDGIVAGEHEERFLEVVEWLGSRDEGGDRIDAPLIGVVFEALRRGTPDAARAAARAHWAHHPGSADD